MQNFTQIPNLLIRTNKLSASDKLLLFTIMSYRPSYPSYGQLSKITGFGRSKISQSLKALVSLNILSYKQGNNLTHRANTYLIQPESLWNLTEASLITALPLVSPQDYPPSLATRLPLVLQWDSNNTNNKNIAKAIESQISTSLQDINKHAEKEAAAVNLININKPEKKNAAAVTIPENNNGKETISNTNVKPSGSTLSKNAAAAVNYPEDINKQDAANYPEKEDVITPSITSKLNVKPSGSTLSNNKETAATVTIPEKNKALLAAAVAVPAALLTDWEKRFIANNKECTKLTPKQLQSCETIRQKGIGHLGHITYEAVQAIVNTSENAYSIAYKLHAYNYSEDELPAIFSDICHQAKGKLQFSVVSRLGGLLGLTKQRLSPDLDAMLVSWKNEAS